jgi:hypothetical protein
LSTALVRGLVDDRVRVVAGVLALLAAGVGVASLLGRAVVLDERTPLLVAVRLVTPALLALGGHLLARHVDDRGPALLVALGLLLAPGVSADLVTLLRVGETHPLAVGGLVQSVLGVLAAALAWLRLGTATRERSALSVLGPPARAALIGAVVVLALAELYPSVASPFVGALQPLVLVVGLDGLPTLLAALGVALIAVLTARVEPAAGALALGALAAVTLGQVVLLLGDVLAEQVAATIWLWLRLLGGVLVGTAALRLFRGSGGAAPSPGAVPSSGAGGGRQ